MTPRVVRVVYLCWPNGGSLHNVGRALVAPMAARGIRVDVVDSRAWFVDPTPADVAVLAHLSFLWPGFPYRRHVGALVGIVHDPDELSTFHDRLTWVREPLHPVPALHALDRVLTCSDEMAAVLRTRYGLRVWQAATHPHNAAAIADAVGTMPARDDRVANDAQLVRFLSTALAPPRAAWRTVVGRCARGSYWLRDERGRPSVRQLASLGIREHRKNTPWLTRLAAALAGDPRAAVDFLIAPRVAPLDEAAYVARLARGDVYVCTSYMEGGPLPVMEAVLAGLAVVTTPVGQTARWVTHGINGVICGTYAEVEHACRRYLDDPALLAAHRAQSRAVAARRAFDADGWAAFLRGTAPSPEP